jgi:hypothetical protein
MAKSVFSVGVVYKNAEKVFSSNRVRAYILNALKKESKTIKYYLNMTTENWKDKPEFSDKLRYDMGNPRIFVAPVGTTRAVKYWSYVDKGTRYRWVNFVPGYVPMTQVPGSFGDNRPHTTIKNYTILDRTRMKPGIRARDWSTKLQRYRLPFLVDELDEAIRKGLTQK